MGNTTRIIKEDKGLPTGYIVGGALGLVALGMILGKGKKNGEPSFFKKYVLPLVMAAAYKKVMEVVENKLTHKDSEMVPAATA